MDKVYLYIFIFSSELFVKTALPWFAFEHQKKDRV